MARSKKGSVQSANDSPIGSYTECSNQIVDQATCSKVGSPCYKKRIIARTGYNSCSSASLVANCNSSTNKVYCGSYLYSDSVVYN